MKSKNFTFKVFLYALVISTFTSIYFLKSTKKTIPSDWVQKANTKVYTDLGSNAEESIACFSHREPLSYFKSNTLDLTKKFDGKEIDLPQKAEIISKIGVDTSNFSTPEMSYLQEAGSVLKTQTASTIPMSEGLYSECNNIVCMINKVYDNVDLTIGHKIFQIYMDTGYLININANTPGIAIIKNMTYKDYLFTPDQIDAIWSLFKVLPDSLKHLDTLKSLHRIPDKYELPGAVSTCGLAKTKWSEHSDRKTKEIKKVTIHPGTITFDSGCLGTDASNTRKHDSEIFLSTSHELGHHFDYSWGFKNFKTISNRLSFTEDFYKLSGWVPKKLVDTNTGNVTLSWEIQQSRDSDGFITNYSKSGPQEDFAESIAHHRFKANEFLSTSPKKSDLIANTVYNGNYFTIDAFIDRISARAITMLSGKLKEVSANCLKIKSKSVEDTRTCIRESLENIAEEVAIRVKKDYPEGCDILANHYDKIYEKVRGYFKPRVDRILSSTPELMQEVALIEEMRLDILRVNSDEILLSCVSEENPNYCFNSKSKKQIGELEKKYSVLSAWPGVKASLKSDHSFERALQRIYKIYDAIFLNAKYKLIESGRILASACLKDKINYKNKKPPLKPYDGGVRFVEPSLLACINLNAKEKFTEVIQSHLNGLNLTLADNANIELLESRYISDLVYGIEKVLVFDTTAKK